MQPVFTQLDTVLQPNFRIKEADSLRLQSTARNMRIQHIAVILFASLSAVLGICLCISGFTAPIFGTHLLIGASKCVAGVFLGYAAYDLYGLHTVLDDTEKLVSRCADLGHPIDKNAIRAERDIQYKKYKKLTFVDDLLDLVWPREIP